MFRFFPFLKWAPELRNMECLRADIIAGITVALVLIPQSMAYAQLAGLPAYYGLYAAFLPPIVAALFGSSRQLATGPVAVVSLLTAAALEPIATAGGDAYIAYAILLALMVGIFQLGMGLLRLGVLVNFLSHPVVLGFTNAAAIIIATSQLSKVFGVDVEKAPHHYETVWNTLVAAASSTHFMTLIFALLAFAIMIGLRRLSPRLPGVLIAVAVTTSVSWLIGFERVSIIKTDQITDAAVRKLVMDQLGLRQGVAALKKDLTLAAERLQKVQSSGEQDQEKIAAAQVHLDSLNSTIDQRIDTLQANKKKLKWMRFDYLPGSDQQAGRFYSAGQAPPQAELDSGDWRLTGIQDDGMLRMNAGGRVVGMIPEGLPSFRVPEFSWDVLMQIIASAITISLIGFMEAISIAKAMAARTRQHLDPNQELIGQGLSNIVGSLFQSYPASGSFSRSAVNIDAGARTGFSSVTTSIVVVITLLWLTPLLYHLPQATLAAVIMMAVFGLVNIKALKHTWKVQRHDGIVAVTTFVLTLAFAPHLDKSIIIGVVLSLGLYLYRTMQPRVAIVSRHEDGTLRDLERFDLLSCPNITVLRFDGTLYFANTSYFENKVMQQMAAQPELKYIIVDAQGINQIDASGEEMLTALTERLEGAGITILFARMKKQILDVLENSGYIQRFGNERFFRRTDHALDHAWRALGDDHKAGCPLHTPMAAKSAQD